jgi:hypothetical protein
MTLVVVTCSQEKKEKSEVESSLAFIQTSLFPLPIFGSAHFPNFQVLGVGCYNRPPSCLITSINLPTRQHANEPLTGEQFSSFFQ